VPALEAACPAIRVKLSGNVGDPILVRSLPPTYVWILGAVAALAVAMAVVAAGPVVVRARLRADGPVARARLDFTALGGLVRRRVDLPRLGARTLRRWVRRKRLPARARGRRRVRLGRRPTAWAQVARRIPRALRRTLSGRVVVRRLRLTAILGTGDAAATGLLVGSAWAAVGGLFAASHAVVRYSDDPRLDLRPDFTRRRLRLRVDCIAAVRLADIIHAIVRAALASRRRARSRGC
jgi:hypothetical protein